MTALLQTVVAEFLDGVVRAYGPFVIPVTLFAVGAVGYVVLVAVGRAGIGEGLSEDSAPGPADRAPRDAPDEESDARSEKRR